MAESWRGKGSRSRVSDSARFGRNLRAIYGTRVKIPPPGPERDKLRSRLQEVIDRSPLCNSAEEALRFLESEAG